MKKLLLALLIFSFGKALAQKNENISVKGVDVPNFIHTQVYKYPDFKKAKVYFNNGDSGTGRMNYNYLLQTMQFIGPKKDTLVLSNESTVKCISIGLDSFFYDNGFYEWVASSSKARLAIKRSLKATNNTEQLGAFGISSPNGGIQSQDAIRGFASTASLNIDEIFTFIRSSGYYINMGKNHFVEFNKKNIENLFAKKEDKIEKYIKENRINFNKEQDVVDVFSFVNQP